MGLGAAPRHQKTRETLVHKGLNWDFPGGPVVKNPLCNAGDVGLIPRQETKIPCAMELLSSCTPTKESVHHHERSCVIQ